MSFNHNERNHPPSNNHHTPQINHNLLLAPVDLNSSDPSSQTQPTHCNNHRHNLQLPYLNTPHDLSNSYPAYPINNNQHQEKFHAEWDANDCQSVCVI